MTAAENYLRARRDPLAVIILRALHKQDVRTLSGDRGDLGGLALVTTAKIRAAIQNGA